MNWKRIGVLALFVFGIIVAMQNFYHVYLVKDWRLKLYYFLLAVVILFLSSGAFYVWKKEKK